jgi:hypothetical protein
MDLLVSAFGLAILVIGLLGVMRPDALLSFVRRWQTWSGVWTAAVLRVAFGAALWLTAPSSRTPVTLQVLGVVSLVSGVALPLLGVSGFAAIVRWWARQSAAFRRAWAGVACAVGGFVLWSVIG